ncbi:MAG: hypothetical protein NT120_04155 [Candidatus Aenigmarchaeota archaeon]|nr:hypothetical protein [Candidatus Aenigmarchaeota archaeon]
MDYLFGYIGSFFLVAAWINELYRIYKSKNVEAVGLGFLSIYLISTVALLIHAINIQDTVFTGLHIILTILTLVEIDLVMRKRAKKR